MVFHGEHAVAPSHALFLFLMKQIHTTSKRIINKFISLSFMNMNKINEAPRDYGTSLIFCFTAFAMVNSRRLYVIILSFALYIFTSYVILGVKQKLPDILVSLVDLFKTSENYD